MPHTNIRVMASTASPFLKLGKARRHHADTRWSPPADTKITHLLPFNPPMWPSNVNFVRAAGNFSTASNSAISANRLPIAEGANFAFCRHWKNVKGSRKLGGISVRLHLEIVSDLPAFFDRDTQYYPVARANREKLWSAKAGLISPRKMRYRVASNGSAPFVTWL